MTREVPEDGHGAAAASLTEQIAAVMHAHRLHSADPRRWRCQCGKRGEPATLADFRAHVASQLARLVEREKREAWSECVQEAEDCGWMHDLAADDMAARNPYARD